MYHRMRRGQFPGAAWTDLRAATGQAAGTAILNLGVSRCLARGCEMAFNRLLANVRSQLEESIMAVFLPAPDNWEKALAEVKVKPDGALSKVLSLRGVTFDWRREDFPALDFTTGRSVGFIAQEVERIVPEAVKRDDKGFRSVAYSHLTPVLVEAVKEQQKQITAQQQTITELRRQNSALNARLDALERAASTITRRPVGAKEAVARAGAVQQRLVHKEVSQ